jgi:SsrA-binding protein
VEKNHVKLVAENRKARHDYLIEDKYEAGMVLVGTEVKSLRMGKANLKDSYARIKNGEVFVYQMHIGAYPFAYYNNHDPLRPRKLLLHNHEIKKLYGKVKLSLALARGKQSHDKRETIRRRDQKRELDRERKNNR